MAPESVSEPSVTPSVNAPPDVFLVICVPSVLSIVSAPAPAFVSAYEVLAAALTVLITPVKAAVPPTLSVAPPEETLIAFATVVTAELVVSCEPSRPTPLEPSDPFAPIWIAPDVADTLVKVLDTVSSSVPAPVFVSTPALSEPP